MYLRSIVKPTCLMVFGFSLNALISPTLQAQETPNIQISGFVYEASSIEGEGAALLYEAARSHKVEPVQWHAKWLQRTKNGDTVSRSATFRLSAVDDFAACAALPPLSYKTLYDREHQSEGQVMLLELERFDHELVLGKCIAITPTDEPTARYTVKPNGRELLVMDSRGSGRTAKNRYDVLSVFGADIGPSGHDLWSRDGMTRRLDPVEDNDLVRAIRASQSTRLAALRVIASRMERPPLRGCQFTQTTLRKPTGASVVEAVLDSEILAQGHSEVRLQTMRALIAMRPAVDHDDILRQLILGLETDIEDNRAPGEIAWQRRVAGLIGEKAAAMPEGRPAFQSLRHFEVGAALALVTNSKVTRNFAEHFSEDLKKRMLRSLGAQPCSESLVAAAPYGENVLLQLLDKVATEARVIPIVQNRIQNIAAGIQNISKPLQDIIGRRCASSQGFLPNGNPESAAKFCRNMAMRKHELSDHKQ